MSRDHDLPRPHSWNPPGAQAPVTPGSPEYYYGSPQSPYAFEYSSYSDVNTSGSSQSVPGVGMHLKSRSGTSPTPPTDSISFPEPQIFRSATQHTLHPPRPMLRPSLSHREPLTIHRDLSSYSLAYDGYTSAEEEVTPVQDNLSRELSDATLQSEEGLRHFQHGELDPSHEEWHRLVPPEAVEALGKREVQRQSIIFEAFKSEREYVADLEAVKDVFIEALKAANPPVLPKDHLEIFISEVFYNVDSILNHHHRMLAALFDRQREQHPLVQSISDIILETTLVFCPDYQKYIGHYPIAEARHRNEMKRNQRYQAFTQQCSQDPRIRKRDLITFLSRPVTRLPRLSLILEQIAKYSEPDHPDKETLPLILSILSEFLQGTQAGIAAAEDKVKFWDLCESLEFVKGEIIDMDVYDHGRSLEYSGPLARRSKSVSGTHAWADLFVALLDNYFIMTKEEKKANGPLKRRVVSRPIPLHYLRLGSFDDPPELRREKADDGGLLESLRSQQKAVYPFTVYHAADMADRRYTLYAINEATRQKWREALENTLAVHQARQEGNMWFVARPLSMKFFTSDGTNSKLLKEIVTGKVITASPFIAGTNQKLLVVGCETGVYVGHYGQDDFQKIFSGRTTNIATLQSFNKLIVQINSSIHAYSLDLLARVATGKAQHKTLAASAERIADGNGAFFMAGQVGKRTILAYAVKTFLHVAVNTLEAIHPSEMGMTLQRKTPSFRKFGEPITVPKDVHSIVPLVKTFAILGERTIAIVDPANHEKSSGFLVPDLSTAADSAPVALLKSRIEAAKPLGLVKNDAELLLIYDSFGCYITKHGLPGRNAGIIRWEILAQSYVQHGTHFLLFSPQFIEIRETQSSKLVQVIPGEDLRLLHQGSDSILIANKGEGSNVREDIVELSETTEIAPVSSPPLSAQLPSPWDGPET